MSKTYILNSLKTILLLLVLTTVTGCNKWLDVKPENEQPADGFWKNKEEVDAVMMGTYEKLRTTIERLIYWGELRGDVLALGPDMIANIEAMSVKQLDIKPDNSMLKWVDIYSTIGRCNTIIKFAPGVLAEDKTFTQKACDAYIAEAVWLRSLCYFYLVRTFRDVPYITEPYLDDSQEFRVAKSDGWEIMDKLVADLNANIKTIPVAYKAGSWMNKGRATTWGFYALLADIYLWQEDYDNAINMCQNIEKSGLFTLLPNKNWFNLYYPGNSDESIFELQWNGVLLQTNNLFRWFHNGSQNNFFSISDSAIEMFNIFPADTDIRGLNGTYVTSKKVWKYAGTSLGGVNIRESSQYDSNWIVYRFADIILMKAEAMIMRGEGDDNDKAYEIITQIRERAGCVIHPNLPDNQSDALDLIMDERMRELSFEGKRWYDLVRMAVRNNGQYKNKLISLLLKNVDAKDRPLFESKLQNTYGYYFPINERDIDASGGLLEQNPYYI